jgi:hypothetical protein
VIILRGLRVIIAVAALELVGVPLGSVGASRRRVPRWRVRGATSVLVMPVPGGWAARAFRRWRWVLDATVGEAALFVSPPELRVGATVVVLGGWTTIVVVVVIAVTVAFGSTGVPFGLARARRLIVGRRVAGSAAVFLVVPVPRRRALRPLWWIGWIGDAALWQTAILTTPEEL